MVNFLREPEKGECVCVCESVSFVRKYPMSFYSSELTSFKEI